MADKYSLVDPEAAALWHAIALRRLHAYRAARKAAKQHGDDLAGLIGAEGFWIRLSLT